MSVITRFAPSPTGYLHIGGARTALFNYLYAKKMGGKFLLRIEDTDVARSTNEAIEAIFNGLKWLGIDHDGEAVFQMQNQKRHIEVANQLLSEDKAYKCYCSKEDLDYRRKEAESKGKVYVYDGRCRDLKSEDIPANVAPVIRLKINHENSTIINDKVMGKVEVQNSLIDDFIIVRSDGTPTYMFAVVVDDHDMAVTDIIRGDDHFTNSFRQYQVYKACGWEVPNFSHLALIHSSEGVKLSKRYGSVSVESYQDMGFLPEAIRNYLLRLGWSHGNDEIISDEQAIEWFNLENINKSPSRFDINKLKSLNAHYIKQANNDRLINIMNERFLPQYLTADQINPNYQTILQKGLNDIKNRSKTLIELTENSLFYIRSDKFIFSDELKQILLDNKQFVEDQITALTNLNDFNRNNIHDLFKEMAVSKDIKLGDFLKVARILLVGQLNSPASVFDIIENLGREISLQRLKIINEIV